MPDTFQLGAPEFARRVRAKYPGVYDHIDDDELTNRVIQKYPEYASVVQTSETMPQAEGAPFSQHFLGGFGITPESFDQPAPTIKDLAARTAASVGTFGMSEAIPAVAGMAKNLYQRVKAGAGEAMDAGENIAQGQPVLPNLGKALYGGENALMRSVPMVTPSVQEFGESVYKGDLMAALGDATSVLAQGALGADRPGEIAPKYGARLLSGESKLPTINPDAGGLAGGILGHIAQPETGLSPFYGYMGGRVAARLMNKALESEAANRAVGIALGGRAGQGRIPTLSPLEAGETSVPQPPSSPPPTGPLVPPLNEETLPALESPTLRGVAGRPPSRADVPNLSAQAEMESPLGRGVTSEAGPEAEPANVTGPSLLDRVQSPLEEGHTDIVQGNSDTDVTSLKEKYPHLFPEEGGGTLESMHPDDETSTTYGGVPLKERITESRPTQTQGRAETVEDQGILSDLRQQQQTEGNRLLKKQFEEAGAVGGHPAREGLYEAVTGTGPRVPKEPEDKFGRRGVVIKIGDENLFGRPVGGDRKIGTLDAPGMSWSYREAASAARQLEGIEGFENVRPVKLGKGYTIGWGDANLLQELPNRKGQHLWQGRAFGIPDSAISEHIKRLKDDWGADDLHPDDFNFIRAGGSEAVTGTGPKVPKNNPYPSIKGQGRMGQFVHDALSKTDPSTGLTDIQIREKWLNALADFRKNKGLGMEWPDRTLEQQAEFKELQKRAFPDPNEYRQWIESRKRMENTIAAWHQADAPMTAPGLADDVPRGGALNNMKNDLSKGRAKKLMDEVGAEIDPDEGLKK